MPYMTYQAPCLAVPCSWTCSIAFAGRQVNAVLQRTLGMCVCAQRRAACPKPHARVHDRGRPHAPTFLYRSSTCTSRCACSPQWKGSELYHMSPRASKSACPHVSAVKHTCRAGQAARPRTCMHVCTQRDGGTASHRGTRRRQAPLRWPRQHCYLLFHSRSSTLPRLMLYNSGRGMGGGRLLALRMCGKRKSRPLCMPVPKPMDDSTPRPTHHTT